MKQWQSLMAAEEKRTGLPAGLLASLVQQETGGQKRFLDNPADFHYRAGPNGEKPKSSARGLGGILEGTARDPGYGVAPLKDWSVPEQLRFMADYTLARGKQAGGLEAGLAGYGDGGKYAQQVLGRLGKQVSPLAMPDAAIVAAARQSGAVGGVEIPPELLPQVVAKVAPKELLSAPVYSPEDPWAGMTQLGRQDVRPVDLSYGDDRDGFGFPKPKSVIPQGIAAPDFKAFGGFKGRA